MIKESIGNGDGGRCFFGESYFIGVGRGRSNGVTDRVVVQDILMKMRGMVRG